MDELTRHRKEFEEKMEATRRRIEAEFKERHPNEWPIVEIWLRGGSLNRMKGAENE